MYHCFFRRHVCLSNLKQAPSRELPQTARKTVFSHLNETTLSQGRAVSSLKLYAQAKLRLVDSCQNRTCADYYRKLITWAQVHDLAFRHYKPDWNVLLTLTVDSPFCSNIHHSNESQLTVVKLEHPLAVITWLYHGIIFLYLGHVFFKVFQ